MSRLNLIFLFIFVSLLIWISFFQADKVNRIQKGTLSLFAPFIKASGQIAESTSALEGEKLSYAQMELTLESAQRERDRLRLEVLQLDELIYENNELRRSLRYKTKSPLNLMPTRVVNRKPLNWYNTFVIDKGEADGVRADFPVIVPEGDDAALVGKISETIGPHSSVVLLLTDEMCQVPAKIKGTQEEGIVNGERAPVRNHPTLKLRYLSKEVDIKQGDRIISSGIGEVFRQNLLLGEVLLSRRGVIDTEATLVPSVDFEKLVDVFIVMPNGMNLDYNETEESEPIRISSQP